MLCMFLDQSTRLCATSFLYPVSGTLVNARVNSLGLLKELIHNLKSNVHSKYAIVARWRRGHWTWNFLKLVSSPLLGTLVFRYASLFRV